MSNRPNSLSCFNGINRFKSCALVISGIVHCCWCVIRALANHIYSILNFPPSVKVHMLVAGETLQTHVTFMQKLKLQIELCKAESCDVILLFCPVASRIGTDMEAAMARVTENKPVILVFMHHCNSPDHMTNITMEPEGRNIVKVVHCAFHESNGLLQCQGNKQAVNTVRLMLQKYQDRNGPPVGKSLNV